MRTLCIVTLLLLSRLARAELSGQHVSDRGTGVAVQEHAIGHVEQGAVNATVEREAVHVEAPIRAAVDAGAVSIGRVFDGRGAMRTTVEPGAISGVVQPGAVTFSECGQLAVAKGAVPVTISGNIEQGAVTFTFQVAPGAVVIEGARMDSALKVNGSPWGWIAGLLGVGGWGVACKMRRHVKERELAKRVALGVIGQRATLWDVIF
jgi:hypothetical protein